MRRLSTLMAVLLAAGLMACPPSTIPDTDDNAGQADLPRLPPDIEVQDALDFTKGDKIDWKVVTAFDTGKGKITAIVGDPFAGAHGMVGEIGLYAKSGPPALVRVPIVADEHNYTLEFDVEADESYLLQVSAKSGKAAYKLNFAVAVPPKDPCLAVECAEDEECKEGKCVKVEESNECDPKCTRGLVCVAGKCEKPCGGSCPKGEYCNRPKNTCMKDPCYQKTCGANQSCKGGQCIDKVVPKAEGCNPPCGADEVCQGSACVKTGGAEPPADGPVAAKIIQTLPQGNKTFIVLDRGSKHGVKVGATGTITGVAGQFKITEVYTFRSKAVIGVEEKAIGTNRSVMINR